MIRIIMTGSNWLCLYQELIMFLRQCDDTVTLGLFRYNKAGVYIIRIIDIFGPYPFFKNHIFFPNYSKKNPSFPPVFQFLPLIFAFFWINNHIFSPTYQKLIFLPPFPGGGVGNWKIYNPEIKTSWSYCKTF